MKAKLLLALAVATILVAFAMGEASAVESLKAKVESGKAAAPCDKGAPAGPPPKRQFLDVRLPHVVDDYHPPVGGFNPTDIPDKEVDVAARKILREIQAAEKEAKANGDAPAAPTSDGVLTTEEHKALKQLLLDADILVRAASKALSENGPIEAETAKKVAASAVKKAAKAEKKVNRKKLKKLAKKAKKAAKKAAAAKPAAPAAPATPAAPAATVTAKAPVIEKASKKADIRVKAKAPTKETKSDKAGTRGF